MAVYGYTRVSTDKQADTGESLTVQERQLQGWCMMHSHTMDQLFVEAGVSGGKPIGERPQGAQLLARLQPGDIIVAPKLDRLFRSSRDALNMVHEFRKQQVRVWLLDLGEVTGEGLAEAFLTIAAAFATLERHQIKERIKHVKQDQKERGRYLGGKVPFGYTVNPHGALVEHQGQQAIITRLRQLASTTSIRKARLAVIEECGVNMSLATAARLLAG